MNFNDYMLNGGLGDAIAAGEMGQQINDLNARVASLQSALANARAEASRLEEEVKYLKCRDAALLAEVKALIKEIEACPHPEYHELIVPTGEKDKKGGDVWPIDKLYNQEFERVAKEIGYRY